MQNIYFHTKLVLPIKNLFYSFTGCLRIYLTSLRLSHNLIDIIRNWQAPQRGVEYIPKHAVFLKFNSD